jgi:hypothetical protein
MRAIVMPIAATLVFVSSYCFAQVDNKQRSIQTITYAEFSKLPENYQALYIAGVIDGISYMGYNYDIPNRDEWNACVRATPLRDLVLETIAYVKANPEEAQYPVPWPLAKAIGKRRPCVKR